MTGLAGDFDIKLVCAVFDQRIDRTHDFSKMHRRSILLGGTNFAVKVPEIDAFG